MSAEIIKAADRLAEALELVGAKRAYMANMGASEWAAFLSAKEWAALRNYREAVAESLAVSVASPGEETTTT